MIRKGSRSAPCIATIAALAALFFSPLASARYRAATPANGNIDVSGLINAARQQFEQGQYGAAISTLESAQSQNPAMADIYFWMGRALFEVHDFDRAIGQFEKAISLNANVSSYHDWLGRAYGSKADKEKSFFVARNAKGQFETAVKLDPSNVAARRDLADYCMQAPWIVGGNRQEALSQVNAIAAINPVEGHLVRAEYDVNVQKNPQQAGVEYQQVIAEKPQAVEPYLEAAAFFQQQNEIPQMKAAIDALAQAHPDDPRLTFYRGVYNIVTNGNLVNAEEDLKSYLASTPERSNWPSHSSARDWLGKLYQQQGKRVEAAEQYRAALQLNPENHDAKAHLQELESAVR